MANYKKRDHYFIPCEGKQIEIEESVYRVWAYYHNKEIMSARAFLNRNKRQPDGTILVLPSRCMYMEQHELHDRLSGRCCEPDKYVGHNEVRRTIHSALSQLDDLHRQVILLLFFDGLSEVQAAARLGKSQSSVSNYKLQALATLRETLSSSPYSSQELLEMASEGL